MKISFKKWEQHKDLFLQKHREFVSSISELQEMLKFFYWIKNYTRYKPSSVEWRMPERMNMWEIQKRLLSFYNFCFKKFSFKSKCNNILLGFITVWGKIYENNSTKVSRVYIHSSLQLGAVLCVHLVFLVDEITHKTKKLY